MHFGLYAFDLFEVIYDEAWEIAHSSDEAQKSSASFVSFVSFVVQYPDKAAFLADVPRLIIEHNLHGIDIDPRAAQIAGLSLWLRAQRAWQQQGLRPQDRPASAGRTSSAPSLCPARRRSWRNSLRRTSPPRPSTSSSASSSAAYSTP